MMKVYAAVKILFIIRVMIHKNALNYIVKIFQIKISNQWLKQKMLI